MEKKTLFYFTPTSLPLSTSEYIKKKLKEENNIAIKGTLN